MRAECSHVVRVRREDGSPAVLKRVPPGEEATREAQALTAFAGRGCVALFAYDASAGTLLMERAEPGNQLAELCEEDDERATSIAATLVRTLPREVRAGMSFPTIDTWLHDLKRLPPFDPALVSDAIAVAGVLATSPSQALLLHGDLHQFNILRGRGTWLAIDPKGVIGERECEIAPLILNPVGANLSDRIERRIIQLCDEAELDRQRAYAWTFVRAVLAILWSFEDDGDAPDEWIECANLLRRSHCSPRRRTRARPSTDGR